MAWFKELAGFDESSASAVASQFATDGEMLTSKPNGRIMRHGRFDMPSLADLRTARPTLTGALRLGEVVGNVQELHLDGSNRRSVFQVASQFNMLEMIGPSATPEDGVDRYERDPTQGPACAVACGAATIYRNYLVPVGEQVGQSASNQLNGLADLCSTLGVDVPVKNGYALPSDGMLGRVNEMLIGLDEPSRDELMGWLRVGVHADTEVTLQDAGHLVTQVFCSAVPIAYSGLSLQLWEPLARLVLDAAYEATFHAALATVGDDGRRKVYLTMLGGGAFGNPTSWIVDAIERTLGLFRTAPLDVWIVSFNRPNVEIAPLLRPPASWADSLFRPEPKQWGLRGDVYLWEELQSALRKCTLPKSRNELRSLIESIIGRLAGARFIHLMNQDGRFLRLDRYEEGGMSGGCVSPSFWATDLIPLLTKRFAEST